MEIIKEELEQCEVLLTVTFEAKRVDKLLQKAARKISRQYKIPGFRPGKAPYRVILRRFGAEALQQQFFEDDGEKLIEEALAEAEVQPYAQVHLEGFTLTPLSFKLRVPTNPVVVLGDYRNIQLDVPPIAEVTDETVEDVLRQVQEQNAVWVPVDQPAELGNVISMLVSQTIEDEPLTEKESLDYTLALADPAESEEDVAPQHEFVNSLLGLSAGNHKEFSITYPADYDNEHAGKTVTFNVEVSAVKIKDVDPIDDEFAQAIGNRENLEEWRRDIRQNIIKQRERKRDQELGQVVLEQIVEQTEELKWPPVFEEQLIDEDLKRQEAQLRETNLTMEAYLKMQNKTPEEWRELTRQGVVSQLKSGLVLNKLAELEQIEVTEEEILEQAKYISDISGQGDRLWQYILQSEGSQREIANQILADKVVMRLATIAKGEAPSLESTTNGNEDATTS